MSRRIKRSQPKSDRRQDRPARADKRPFRQAERVQGDRPKAHRPGGKPPRFSQRQENPEERRKEKRAAFVAEPAKPAAEPAPLPTKVQTVLVTADENNMRVDRF